MSTAVDTLVNEIVDKMSEPGKITIRFTKEADLIQYHNNWGRQIRNTYKLWENTELVKATGKGHPDDASGVIIHKVWERLQETELELNPDCPQIPSAHRFEDWRIPYSPVCEECGLPYYKGHASWVHPFKDQDGNWVGL